ncbi:unnamed protein product [Allacma fusca]|uniref:Uncharacterized protein n=1 Tax=Allacma fusca TaxID=39272 RepID=A0A8J2JP76_9HEXA|nr:unnamed protein product [Allacma fusca]
MRSFEFRLDANKDSVKMNERSFNNRTSESERVKKILTSAGFLDHCEVRPDILRLHPPLTHTYTLSSKETDYLKELIKQLLLESRAKRV